MHPTGEHAHDAGKSGKGKAPESGQHAQAAALHKMVCRNILVRVFLQHHVGEEHPQVPERHAHRIQADQPVVEAGHVADPQGRDDQQDGNQHGGQFVPGDRHPIGVHFGEHFGHELGIHVRQQDLDGGVDGNGQGGRLSQGVADGVDDHEGLADAIVFTQLGEAVVGPVHHQVLGDVGGVEHQAHGKGPQQGGDRHHSGHEDHGFGIFRRRFLQVVDIGAQPFAAAHRKDQDAQCGHVVKIEGGHQGIPVQAVGEGPGGGQVRSCQGQQDVEDAHDEHEAPGQGPDPFQGVDPFGGVPQEEKENRRFSKKSWS